MIEMDGYRGYQFYREFADTAHEHPLDTFIAVRMDRVETVERREHTVLGRVVTTLRPDVLYDAVSAISPRDPNRFRPVKVNERYLQRYTEPVSVQEVYQHQPELPLYLDLNPPPGVEDEAASRSASLPAEMAYVRV